MNKALGIFALNCKAGDKSKKKYDALLITPTYSNPLLFCSAIPERRGFIAPHCPPGLNQPPHGVRPKLNQRFIRKENLIHIAGETNLLQRDRGFNGATDELGSILIIAENLIQALYGRSIQPQCRCNRKSLRSCHLVTIRQPCCFQQTDVFNHFTRHLLLTFKIPLIRMQLVLAVTRSRPCFAQEPAAC
ncbi:hypothetical protein FE249_20280 (plasmid) [Acidiphilium multivorum]|nr:hypothetical protein FE249_20280 [Acidiphilium multivorum]